MKTREKKRGIHKSFLNNHILVNESIEVGKSEENHLSNISRHIFSKLQ